MKRPHPLPLGLSALIVAVVLLLAAVPLFTVIKADCRPCWGTGQVFASYFPACTACGGSGRVRLSRALAQRLSEKIDAPALSSYR